MSIALYDADIIAYKEIPFNLEIMKLAAYFMKHHEITIFSKRLIPDKYSQFYYRQDYDNVSIPSKILMSPNVHFGGRFFNPSNYMPFDEDIEKMYPITDIYSIYEDYFVRTKFDVNIYKSLMRADHLRLSLDGRNPWDKAFNCINFDTVGGSVIFHDYNLGEVDGAYESIVNLLKFYTKKKNQRYVGMKFPVILKSVDEIAKWNTLPSSGKFFNIQYNGILSDEELDAVFLYQSSNPHRMKQFTYYVTPEPVNEDEFYKKALPSLLYQLQRINNFWPLQCKYNLTYFKNQYIIDILELFNDYAANLYQVKKERNSVFDYAWRMSQCEIVKAKKLKDVNYVRELFQYVQKTNYPLFKQMYERRNYKLEGGKIIEW